MFSGLKLKVQLGLRLGVFYLFFFFSMGFQTLFLVGQVFLEFCLKGSSLYDEAQLC